MAQVYPGFWFCLEALKGHLVTGQPGATSRNAGCPLQGFVTLERVSQGKPRAMLSWPFGPPLLRGKDILNPPLLS
jgi:hypothetical protein